MYALKYKCFNIFLGKCMKLGRTFCLQLCIFTSACNDENFKDPIAYSKYFHLNGKTNIHS